MGSTQSSIEKVVSEGRKTGKADWFQKTRHLGSGCFADVYCCTLGNDLPHVALKILDTKKIGVKELSALNDCMNSLEGKTIHHENVIEYYGKFVLDDKIYIFMEYMKYGSLKYLYESLGEGIHDQIVGIYTKQILVGLSYLHQTQNIIHRDLKCDNILLCGPLTVKICDLEFCKGLSKTEAYVDEKCGTGVFMAPEVNANRGYTYSADIWSLGVTVLEMKLGKVPDQINNLLNEDKPFAYYEGESSNLSGNIMQILSSCLVLEPEKRADIATLLKLEICMVNTINTREIENILMHMKAKTDTDDDLREITNQQIQNTCFDHFLIEIKKESSNGAASVSGEVSKKTVNISLSENECFIGKGLFGETSCVQLRDGQGFAALKKIKTNKLAEIKQKQLIKLFEYFQSTSLSHDYVIHFYQSISTPDQFRIYSEFAEFGSLADLYQANGAFIDHQVGSYIKQVLHGLEYLHSKRIIHGGIKCKNVLLAERCTVKLSDYGLARVLCEQTRSSATQSGISQLLAPEVNIGANYSYSADIWSVGACALEMKLGDIPTQLNYYMARGPALDFYKRECKFSSEIMQFLRSCLKKDEKERASICGLLKMTLCKMLEFSEDDMEELIDELKKCKEDTKELIAQYVPWQSNRRQYVEVFMQLADLIDRIWIAKNSEHTDAINSNKNIADLGIILTPFTTSGEPVVLKNIGTAVTIAGATVNIAGTYNRMSDIETIRQQAEYKAKEDKENLAQIIKRLTDIFVLMRNSQLVNKLHFVFTHDEKLKYSHLLNTIQPRLQDWKIGFACKFQRHNMAKFFDDFQRFMASFKIDTGKLVDRSSVTSVLDSQLTGCDLALLSKATEQILNNTITENAVKLRDSAFSLMTEVENIEKLCKSLVLDEKEQIAEESDILKSVLGD